MPGTIQRLKDERLKSLKQYITLKRGELQAQRQAGVLLPVDFAKADLELLKLERQTAQSKNERIAISEKTLRYAQLLEDSAKANAQAGVTSSLSVYEAHVFTIECQIALEEDKAAR